MIKKKEIVSVFLTTPSSLLLTTDYYNYDDGFEEDLS